MDAILYCVGLAITAVALQCPNHASGKHDIVTTMEKLCAPAVVLNGQDQGAARDQMIAFANAAGVAFCKTTL